MTYIADHGGILQDVVFSAENAMQGGILAVDFRIRGIKTTQGNVTNNGTSLNAQTIPVYLTYNGTESLLGTFDTSGLFLNVGQVSGLISVTGQVTIDAPEGASLGLRIRAKSTSTSWVYEPSVTDAIIYTRRQHIAPVINSVTFTDAAGLIDRFGNLVSSESRPWFDVDATLDPEIPDLTITGKQLTIDGVPFEQGSIINASGDVPYKVTVTDSYGASGEYSGTVRVLPYGLPAIGQMNIERYVTYIDDVGNPYYVADDGGETVRVSLAANVTSLNGRNAWSIAAAWESGAATMFTGSDGGTIIFTGDRDAITAHFAAEREWLITVTITDSLHAQSYEVRLPKAGGIFNIEKTGVAVGMRSTGTKENPRFQVAYALELLGGYISPSGRQFESYDTGWVPITLTTACTAWSDSDIPEIRRIGSVCYIRGGIRLASSLSSTGTVAIGNIDSQFVPGKTRAQMAVWNDSTSWRSTSLQIPEREGVINLRNRSGSSTSTSVYISLNSSYVID